MLSTMHKYTLQPQEYILPDFLTSFSATVPVVSVVLSHPAYMTENDYYSKINTVSSSLYKASARDITASSCTPLEISSSSHK